VINNIKRSIDICYQRRFNFGLNYLEGGLYKLEQMRQALRVPEAINSWDQYARILDAEREGHFSVHFKGLPFNASERVLMESIGTFDGLLPYGHNGIVGVNFSYDEQTRDRSGIKFSGMMFVAYANRLLAKLAIAMYDDYFYDYAAWQIGRTITMQFQDESMRDKGRRDDRIYGVTRWYQNVWNVMNPVSDEMRAYSRNVAQLRQEAREYLQQGGDPDLAYKGKGKNKGKGKGKDRGKSRGADFRERPPVADI
jgi:hypothetical protein